MYIQVVKKWKKNGIAHIVKKSLQIQQIIMNI